MVGTTADDNVLSDLNRKNPETFYCCSFETRDTRLESYLPSPSLNMYLIAGL